VCVREGSERAAESDGVVTAAMIPVGWPAKDSRRSRCAGRYPRCAFSETYGNPTLGRPHPESNR
jgi:hypothetical protein